MLRSQGAAPLILASASRARAQLLRRVGLRFEIEAADIDERAEDEALPRLGPEGLATRLATRKAAAVAARRPGRWVLGADQLALTDDEPPQLLHKPGNAVRAVESLLRLAGRRHRLVTAAALLGPKGERLGDCVEVTELRMRPFTRREAESYVDAFAPLWSVGAYHIEDAGIALFEEIRGGDFTAIMGLPLLKLLPILRDAGFEADFEAAAMSQAADTEG